jgi:hypothetical protein
VANSHIAILNIEDDEWLAWDLNNDTQTLSLSHTKPLTSNTSSIGLAQDTIFDFGDSINIPKIVYD